ncbi:MAG: hypothetical protein HYV08_00875 [Deltaproteobacteria bacterium]|nr:hypothetical protein [Deltaproteobacteria bacterium]
MQPAGMPRLGRGAGRILVALLLLLGLWQVLSSPAFAERWYGITPGTTSRDEVRRLLGEPNRTLKEPPGAESWIYEGEQAPFGTSGVGIIIRLDSGVVDYIEVEPLQHVAWLPLKERYGEPEEKTTPNEAGLSIYRYRRRGLLIIVDTRREVAVKFGFFRETAPAGPPAPSAGSPPPSPAPTR